MDWIDLLVNLVRARPNIYDRNHPLYKDWSARKNSFEVIANELVAAGFPFLNDADTVHRKWKDIRDTFFKTERAYENAKKADPASAKEPKLSYYKSMQWIRPHSNKNKKDDSKDTSQEVTNEECSQDTIEEAIVVKAEKPMLSLVPKVILTAITPTVQPPAKKSKIILTPKPTDSPPAEPNIAQSLSKPETPDEIWAKLALQYLSKIPAGFDKEKLKLTFLMEVLNHSNAIGQSPCSSDIKLFASN